MGVWRELGSSLKAVVEAAEFDDVFELLVVGLDVGVGWHGAILLAGMAAGIRCERAGLKPAPTSRPLRRGGREGGGCEEVRRCLGRRAPHPGHPPLASLRLLAPPYALRRGRSLLRFWVFRAFWMFWRTPSRLVVISLFQKRRTR